MKHAAAYILAGAIALAGAGASAQDSPATTPEPTATPAMNMEEWSAILREAKPGDQIILGGIEEASRAEIEYKREVLPGPQYIISDDPEYIRVPEGVAVRETVKPGEVRLYTYNVNGVKEPEQMPRKISTVIENLGDGPLTVRFSRYGFWKPSGNYFMCAKVALASFMSGENVPSEPLVIPAGGAAPLDPAVENSVAVFNDLVHGFYQFSIDQPARISVVQTAPDTPSVEANARLATVLESPRRNAGRGLFEVSNYSITSEEEIIDASRGLHQLTIADGKRDPWIVGKDSSSTKTLELKGNYGVMYEVNLKYRTQRGHGLALVTYNGRHASSQWCGAMANVIKVNDGIHPGGVIPIPRDNTFTRKPPEVVLVQLYPPTEDGETGEISFTYSPPGASCLPTPLVFIPVSMER